MTKFDIRLRRQQFKQSRIERYKNYQSIMDKHYEADRKKTKGIMVVVIMIILVIAMLLAFFEYSSGPAAPATSPGSDSVGCVVPGTVTAFEKT